ncbi:histidine kinase [Streptomyces sp. 135]|uniref:sensor histidine kinase n=1 Tax=Streptomyces sp. 135 TaxID=2838850 RepID=UPI001CC08E9B|nr:histidine kinase [Streptomyces sp. 135]
MSRLEGRTIVKNARRHLAEWNGHPPPVGISQLQYYLTGVLLVVVGGLSSPVTSKGGDRFQTGLLENHTLVLLLCWAVSFTLLARRALPWLPMVTALGYLLVADGRVPLALACLSMCLYGGRTRWLWICAALAVYFGLRGYTVPAWCMAQNTGDIAFGNIVTPSVAGEILRRYRFTLISLRLRTKQAENAVVQAAELAAIEERTRFAQHAHDVLGYRLTLLTLQAAALGSGDVQDDELREQVHTIEETARQALGDVRSVLEAMSTPVGARELGRFLEALCRNMRATGMEVCAEVDADLAELSDTTAQLVQRVAREGLTNAGKYAPGATVHLSVVHQDDVVTVDVRNSAGRSKIVVLSSGEMGIRGLRRDIEALGGTVGAGPDKDGGFWLTATIPWDATEA